MQVQVEREIYIRAGRCHELLCQSILTFRDYLEGPVPANDSNYYRARNCLKEGKGFFDQTVQDAKKLLGPIPVYAAKDFEAWRSKALVDNKIVVQGRTPEELAAELSGDDFVKTIMNAGEVETYIQAHFEAQQTGKRKLANIKIRMTLDKLAELLAEGRDLQKKAQRKQQGLPI